MNYILIKKKLVLFKFSLLFRKPFFVLRTIKMMLLHKKSNHQIKSVMLALHYKCNLKCQHCYEKQFTKTDENTLSFQEIKNLIKQCLDMNILAFDFIGGESHLHKDFYKILTLCKPTNHYITLATNGYGLNEKKIRKLYDKGIDKLNISLDSADAEEHDKFRGKKGSHYFAMNAIDICKKIGMDVTVTITIFRNYTKTDNFKKLIYFLISKKIRTNFKLAIPVGNWKDKNEFLVTDEDLMNLEEYHNKYSFLTRDIFENKENLCPAFRDFFTITAYGDVMPCNAVHISFGNIKNESLKKIINRVKNDIFCMQNFKGCPPAEDKNFIDNYLSAQKKDTSYPIQRNAIRLS